MIKKSLLLLVMFFLLSSVQADYYLKELQQKHPFQKKEVIKYYKQYGYSFYRLEKKYGKGVFLALEKWQSVALLILSKQPAPLNELIKHYPLHEAVYFVYSLSDHKYFEKYSVFSHIDEQLQIASEEERFFQPTSLLEETIQRIVYQPTIYEKMPSRMQERLLRFLLTMKSFKKNLFMDSPITFPFLYVTGIHGEKLLNHMRQDILYFFSLIRSNKWNEIIPVCIKGDQALIEMLNIHGWKILNVWNTYPKLYPDLVKIFGRGSISSEAMQQALLFIIKNEKFISENNLFYDFHDKVYSILREALWIPIANNMNLAHRLILDPTLLPLAYNYPQVSRTPLEMSAKYEGSLGELLGGKLAPHKSFLLQCMNDRRQFKKIYGALYNYSLHQKSQLSQIISRYGHKGFVVAIYTDPGKRWIEILGEGEEFLAHYKVLSSGKVEYKKEKVSFLSRLNPLPLDAYKLAARLYKGYHIDTKLYFDAALDVVSFVMFTQKVVGIIGKNLKKKTTQEIFIGITRDLVEERFDDAFKPNLDIDPSEWKEDRYKLFKDIYAIVENAEMLDDAIGASDKWEQYRENEEMKNMSVEQKRRVKKYQDIIKLKDLKLHSQYTKTPPDIITPIPVPTSLYYYSFKQYKKNISERHPSIEIFLLAQFMWENILQEANN